MLGFGAPGVIGPGIPPIARTDLYLRMAGQGKLADGLSGTASIASLLKGQATLKETVVGVAALQAMITGQAAIAGMFDIVSNLIRLTVSMTGQAQAAFTAAFTANLTNSVTSQAQVADGLTGTVPLAASLTGAVQVPNNFGPLALLKTIIHGAGSLASSFTSLALVMKFRTKGTSTIVGPWSGSVPLQWAAGSISYIQVGFGTVVQMATQIAATSAIMLNATVNLAMTSSFAASSAIANGLSGAVGLATNVTSMLKLRDGIVFVANLGTVIKSGLSIAGDIDLTASIRAIIITAQGTMRAGISSLNLQMKSHMMGMNKIYTGEMPKVKLAWLTRAAARFGAFLYPQGNYPMSDLDKGGRFATQTKVYRGPTLGHMMVDVAPEIVVTASPVTVGSGVTIVLVNFAGPCAVTLPNVVQWVRDAYDLGTARAAFDRSLLIKDAFGMAGSNPISVFPILGQTIDGQASYQVNQNHGTLNLYPKSDLTGWFVA